MRGLTILITCLGLSLGLAQPSAAQGRCPSSPSDLTSGVYVSFGTFFTEYRVLADGRIQETEFYVDNTGVRFISYLGIFVNESIDMRGGAPVPGTEGSVEYLSGIDFLPEIVPDMFWRGPTIRRESDGQPLQEPMTVQTGPLMPYQIGSCRYDAFTVTQLTYNEDGSIFEDQLTYLPQLGIAIYHGGADQGQPVNRSEPVDISTQMTMDMVDILNGGGP